MLGLSYAIWEMTVWRLCVSPPVIRFKRNNGSYLMTTLKDVVKNSAVNDTFAPNNDAVDDVKVGKRDAKQSEVAQVARMYAIMETKKNGAKPGVDDVAALTKAFFDKANKD